jgi:hypothetical protein
MISRKRAITYRGAALALAALLTAAFPAAVAAGKYLSEDGIIAAFEGRKVTALVKKRGDVTARMGGRGGMHSFYFYPDRKLKVDRSVVGRGGATTESGKWWTAKKKKGGRLCMQRERADKRCFKITRSGDDYEFYDGKGPAFTTYSVDPL